MMHVTLLAINRIARPASPPHEIPLVGLPHLAASRDVFPFPLPNQGLTAVRIKIPSVRSLLERVFTNAA